MLPPSSVRVWLAAGTTDMRRGMNGLALQVQQSLNRDPHAGDVYVFRGRRGNLLKILWSTTALACRSTPSGWNADDSSGHRQPMASSPLRRRSLATCSKASIGGIRKGPGGLSWQDSAED